MIPAKDDRKNLDNENERTFRGSFVFWLSAVVFIFIDQAAKYLAFHGKVNFRWNILSPALGLTVRSMNFKNYYFAFSIRMPEFLIYFIYGFVLFLIARYLWDHYRELSRKDFLAWVLMVAGAFSNIGERLALGYVRDFIAIATGIFNIADLYIILGIILLIAPKTYKLKPKN